MFIKFTLTLVDDSFPEGRFLIEGYHGPFRFCRNKNGERGVVMQYIREDIPAKRLCSDFPVIQSSYIKINLHKKKWLISCSYNPHSVNIFRHLGIIIRALDIHSSMANDNILLLGDFNSSVDEEAMNNFCT